MINKIYILISDLSEHTQNIILNNKVSFYYSMKEINNTKLNNPRLTLSGKITKLELNKNSSQLKLNKTLSNYYNKSEFVKVLTKDKLISTNDVINTNYCHISICKTKNKNRTDFIFICFNI